MVTRLGRRRCLQIVVVPFLIGFVALALAPNSHVLLVARLLPGFGGGFSNVAASVYIAEIVDTKVRGVMGIFPSLALMFGGLFTVCVGAIVRWYHMTMVCAISPCILLIGTFFLPDSPSFLVVRGRKLEAVTVLRKLRGLHANVRSEIEIIEMKNSSHVDGWQKLLNWYIGKRVAIVIMTFAFQNFCGNYLFTVQTARVLRKTGASMDEDSGTIIVTAARIIGMLVSICFVDRMGRRAVLIASHAISSVFLIILGVYVYLVAEAPPEDTTFSKLTWVPLACVIMIMFGINLGAQLVPFLLASEYFPTSVRGQSFTVCYASGMVFSFVVLQFYFSAMDVFTQAGLYWFCAAVCFVAVVFTLIFVKETKGENIG
ncbi:facilitated trehalose transporter Tret1-2 homolog isoform X2 [Scylla paramamosain]